MSLKDLQAKAVQSTALQTKVDELTTQLNAAQRELATLQTDAQQTAEAEATALKAKVNTAVDAAVQAGKIKADQSAGYLDTLSKGAMVFDLDKAVPKWISRSAVDVNQNVNQVNAPYGTVSFGDNDPLVKELYVYFNLVDEFGYKLTNDFNCELKGAIQQFQIENILEATGNYDKKTSNKARAIQSPIYVFKDKEAVKRLADSCKLEQTKSTDINNIVVPQGGFKYSGQSADPSIGTANDLEFEKVQILMEKALISSGIASHQKHKKDATNWITGYKLNPGDYGDRTAVHVGKLMSYMINALGIDLDNRDRNIVDQQFVNILKTFDQLVAANKGKK
jgi:polyhydroxyalkanoate synthesis regulator phasin